MSFLNITKTQGAILCLFLCIPYGLLYYGYFGQNQFTPQLLTFFLFGVLLHFFQKIEPGTRAELVFFGKARNFFWEDGYCLVPSFLPILHQVGIHLLWSLKKAVYSGIYRSDRDVSIEHFQDQRRPNYNMNTQTTMFGMAVSRILEVIFGWFLEISRGDPELLFQRIGQRIMVLSIILGAFANIFFPNKETRSVGQTFSMVSEEKKNSSQEPRKGMTLVSSGLHVGLPPQMPLAENFVPRPTSTTRLYFNVDSGVDKRKYFLFHEPPLGKFHTITVNEPLCQVIPAGRDVLFFSKYRPQFEGNTENRVEYVVKKENQNPLREVYKNFRGISSKTEVATWKEIYSDWSMVDTESYGIIVRALADEDQPQPGKGLGGIVCF